MLYHAFLALLTASTASVPPDRWSCANNIEVWCEAGDCSTKPADETTPMSISAYRDGAISVCAYTGCWEGKATVAEKDGRILWTGDNFAFSTQPDGAFKADITLLIVEKDGAGFIRAGAIATPLFCERAPRE